jgi:aminoglycoside 6'-N-acetyltransferase I
MLIHIRAIAESDAPSWLRLREALWPSTDHAAEIEAFFRGELDEPEAVLVAADDHDRVVGFVELSVRHDLPGLKGVATGYVEGLFVEPEHRSTGLARRLLLAAQDWARARHCPAFASDRADRVIVDPRFGLRASRRRASNG